MPRSPILTGRIQQRDRAQLRHRLDRRREPAAPAPDAARAAAHAELASWLEAHVVSHELASLEALDLTGYLRDTARSELPPEARLRSLAIHLEPRLSWHDEQPRAWMALERIYTAALRLDPHGPFVHLVHLSRAVTARELAEGLQRLDAPRETWVESPLRRRMMKTANAAMREALALAPDDADVLRGMGDLAYHDPDAGPGPALEWYERAVARDPGHGWAALYRAHCLHDLERWSEAASAYHEVDASTFTGPVEWRHEHLLEQRAHCLLRAGDLPRAEVELTALLERWERSPQLAGQAWGRHLAEAARGPLREALFARARQLFQREEAAREQGERDNASFGLELSMLDVQPAR